jgi:hypothetical protein
MTEPTSPPILLTLQAYQRLSGDGRSTVYNKLGDGRLKGVKDGRRIKITYESARAHLDGLPAAKVRPASPKIAAQ